MSGLSGPENSRQKDPSLNGPIALEGRIALAKVYTTDSQVRHLSGERIAVDSLPRDSQERIAWLVGKIYDRLRLIDARCFSECPEDVENFLTREIALGLSGNQRDDHALVDAACDLAAVCGYVWRKDDPPAPLDDLMPPGKP